MPGRLDAGEDPRPVGPGGRPGQGRAAVRSSWWPSVADPDRPGDRSATAAPRTRRCRRLPSSRMATNTALRVAVLGAGTVGREVVRALLARPARLHAADGAPLELAGVAVRDLDKARGRRDPGRPPDRRAGAPGRLARGRRHRRADGRRRAGPHPDRGRARRRQAGRHREQARRRPPRAGARGDRPAGRRAVPLRGGGRRRDPGPGAARQRTSPRTTSSRIRGIVNGTTNYILTAMAREGRAVRRRPRRRPGSRATPRRTRPATSRATTRSTSSSSSPASAFGVVAGPGLASSAARRRSRGTGRARDHRRPRPRDRRAPLRSG